MKPILKILGSCLLFAILAVGCADDGEPGPQGERGEKGDQGEKGDKGDTGTANVMYSDWFTVDWNEADDPDYKVHSMDIEELGGEFLDHGTILLYAKVTVGANTVIIQLPFEEGDIQEYYGIVLPNSLRILLSTTDPELPDYFPTQELRYVLIPGGINVGGRTGQPDFENYQEVRRFYDLPD